VRVYVDAKTINFSRAWRVKDGYESHRHGTECKKVFFLFFGFWVFVFGFRGF
jgi:hypothetical protein